MKPHTFKVAVFALLNSALLLAGPVGCIVRPEPPEPPAPVVVGGPPVVEVDEFGYRHEGYYDDHRRWHGGYYDERHVRHEDAGDWHHDRR